MTIFANFEYEVVGIVKMALNCTFGDECGAWRSRGVFFKIFKKRVESSMERTRKRLTDSFLSWKFSKNPCFT